MFVVLTLVAVGEFVIDGVVAVVASRLALFFL